MTPDLALVPVRHGRYGGTRLASPPAVAPPVLSAKARALGLRTLEDVAAEYQAQREGWTGPGDARIDKDYPPGPHGASWHCPACGHDFGSRSGARRHRATTGHVVLRWDWYETP